ncbi:PREDICTED: cyclin-dependent [Prunus dulcis]|uniref:PREDICTED: cyclin-dependent n=1 Tax=Prunus dulcis TaxID=3755 RepID=A0A5E4EFA1_PRUDU|nr:PREDICTED: cyclin-dependent [Prunus dulcis]
MERIHLSFGNPAPIEGGEEAGRRGGSAEMPEEVPTRAFTVPLRKYTHEILTLWLDVTWGFPPYWVWNCYKETSEDNVEVVELSSVCFLNVRGQFKMSELSAGVVYVGGPKKCQSFCELHITVGCIFAELVTKQALFSGDSELQQLLHIFRFSNMASTSSLPKKWSPQSLSKDVPNLDEMGLDFLLQQMLQNEPAKRISAKKAM